MPDEECEIKQKNCTTGRSRDKDVHQSDGISYFKATISQFNICYSYLGIPSKFSSMNGFRDKREITVGDPEGREWQLRISHSRGKQRNQRFFYGDWLNFARVNGLVVGDVCTFEYNPGGEKDIMYVSILKKQSEPVMEDTKERGTSSKIEDQSPSSEYLFGVSLYLFFWLVSLVETPNIS
ncbi:hypothetical protein QJS04_geneDACA025018 [Acorus gramineus]|uniref:TF-B3 domain-containing protein n=1 Tax=Acorus gramineus TaxID=55184 RepID=A0AAV9A6C7_ACOGR|nr:hypothetical protein QJS04_geneDACA025018 [Acorus gramineus]